MSRASDKAIESGMGRRRRPEVIKEEVADSILAEMVPSGAVDLPIESLYKSKFQVRIAGGEADINKIAESLQSSGLISPIVVRPIQNPDQNLQCKSLSTDGKDSGNLQSKSSAAAEDGFVALGLKTYEIITGHHRVLAAIRLGWAAIPALIKPMTDRDAAVALTADNSVKKDITDYDRFLHIQMLEETGACLTGRELATALGVSPAQISQTRAFGKLPKAALDVVVRSPEKFGFRAVYDLVNSGLPEKYPEYVVDAFDELVADKIKTQSAIIPWISQRTKARKLPTPSREATIKSPGQPDIRVVGEVGKTIIHAGKLNPYKLAALIENHLSELVES